MSTSVRSPIRTAVVVVHGVGDPNPGDALRSFSSALAAEVGTNLHLEAMGVHLLPDHSHPDTDSLREFFPMALLKGELNDQPIVFAEVFWGQVSSVQQGVTGVLRGIFGLIFGLQAIISGNRYKKPPAGIEDLVTRVGDFGAQVLRGPIFAINILMLIATLAFGVAGIFSVDVGNPDFKGHWIFVICATAVTCPIGLWILMRARRPKGFIGFVRFEEYRVLGWSCLVGAIAWPLAGWLLGASRLSEWSAAAGIPLLLCFTLVSFCLLFVIGLHILVSLFRLQKKEIRRSLGVKTLAFAAQFGLWSGIIPLLWLLVFGVLENQGLSINNVGMMDLFRQNVPAEGIQWLTGGAVLLAFIVTWLLREFYSPSLRLIVGWLGHATIVLATVYGVFAATKMGLESPYNRAQMPAELANSMDWFPVPIDLITWIQDNEFKLVTGLGVLLASSFVLTGIRAGLDIANDVTNYLRYNIAFDKRNIDGKGSREVYERMRPIRGKFNEVIRYLDKNYFFERLVIVSHSQGTVIALDELSHANFGREREWLQNLDVKLITMGSPAAHIFQHYFPVAYPPWKNSKYWGELNKRVNCWLNLYRANDFVGTTMSIKKGDPLFNKFREIKVRKKGGHTNYWRDGTGGKVIAKILK